MVERDEIFFWIKFNPLNFHLHLSPNYIAMNIHWTLKPFQDLTLEELYEILHLRNDVFVVEQKCNYLDIDGKDLKSMHLQGRVNNELVAYVRILPPGLSYDEPSIGRVLNARSVRRQGVGQALMHKAIAETIALHGKRTIKIGAQLYLKRFYESFGFVQCSEPYLEDEIPHIKMILTP